MVGFGNSLDTEQLYTTLRKKIPKRDWRMPLVEIGEARILSISGKDFKCHQNLLSASKLIFSRSNYLNEKLQSEITALYYYVLTIHQEKIGHYHLPFPYLFMGKNLTTIKSFQLAFEYRIIVNEAKYFNSPVTDIIKIVHTLEEHGLSTLACIGYRAAAILSRMRNDFKSAYKYYDFAFTIARRMKLSVNFKQLQNAKAYALFLEGKLDESEQLFSEITIDGQLDPILPVLYENLALLAEARSKLDEYSTLMEKAIAISTQLDSVERIPGEYLYLGQTYENHYQDFERAEHYYKLGYDYAMRYASHGISLTGDRKEVVDAYVRLLNRKKASTRTAKPSKPGDQYAFAQGKPWKEIKDVFHHQLICYHQEYQKNSIALAGKLGMPPSTLYSLQDRLKKRGYLLPEKKAPATTEIHPLHSFIDEHKDLSWTEINRIFEREMIHYLYEKYGYNKQRMAQILKLSYPSMIAKTRELTEVHEHLLPN